MRGEDEPKTTFQTRYGHYELLVIYCGLTIAATPFMDLMNRLFQSYPDSFVIVFIDNILVYSKNECGYIDHLRVVLQILKEHQLLAKYSKCEFWLRSVRFLGHIIASVGFEVNQRKTKLMKNWSRPLTLTDITSFLGLAGYYQRFVNTFASIASPLITVTLKCKIFDL